MRRKKFEDSGLIVAAELRNAEEDHSDRRYCQMHFPAPEIDLRASFFREQV